MIRIDIKTSGRSQFIDITSKIEQAVIESGVSNGICTIFVPHTTAGVTINENADPSVVSDIINTLNKLVPRDAGYTHSEGNADSHVKASLMGSSVQVIVKNGSLVLGTWQGVYFCEFDGPRNRQILVEVK